MCYNFTMDTIILQFFERLRCPALDVVFGVFSFFGEALFVGAFVVFVYWLSQEKTGEQIAVTALSSLALNACLKTAVARPRPYVTGAASLRAIDTPLFSTLDLGDYVSFPSGHAQATSSLFCAASLRAKRIWVGAASLLLVFLVMCSRVYFGVHHPTDVLAGFAIGVSIALLLELVYRNFYGARYFVLCGAALAALFTLPVFPSHDYTMSAGLLAGAAFFLPIASAIKHAPAPFPKRLWRIPAGVLVCAAAFGLTLLFPDDEGFTLLSFFLLTGAATAATKAVFRLFRI